MQPRERKKGYLPRGKKEEWQETRKTGLPVPGGPFALRPHEHTHPRTLCTSSNEASTCKFSLLQALSSLGTLMLVAES